MKTINTKLKDLEVSLAGISKEIEEIEKVPETKSERKYTPNRVIIKKKVTAKKSKRKTRSLSPTMSEKIETIRSGFKSKKTKPKSKRVKSEPPKKRSRSQTSKPRSRSKSKSRSKSRSKK